jgi:hypothetical protein
MPLHLRQLFIKVKDMFSLMEIRTPETRADHEREGRLFRYADPALFGHVIHPSGTRDIYLLGRWGESDTNFIRSVSDVRKVLDARTGFIRRGTLLHQFFYGNPTSWNGDDWVLTRILTTGGCAMIGMLSTIPVRLVAPDAWLQSPSARHLDMGGLTLAGALVPWLALAWDRWRASVRKKSLAKERPDLVRFV